MPCGNFFTALLIRGSMSACIGKLNKLEKVQNTLFENITDDTNH